MKAANIFLTCLIGLTMVAGLMAAPKFQPLDSKAEIGPELNHTLEDVCEFVTNNFTFPAEPITLTNIEIGGGGEGTSTTWLSFKADSITITGLENLEFYDCKIELLREAVIINGAVDKIMIDFQNYTMKGLLVDNIDVEGGGHGSVLVEKFTMLVDVQPNVTHPPYLNEIDVDLGMYQWTVIFEDLMPGTDLGLLFNEFSSELGPEVANAVEDVLNESGVVTDLFNAIIEKAMNSTLLPE